MTTAVQVQDRGVDHLLEILRAWYAVELRVPKRFRAIRFGICG